MVSDVCSVPGAHRGAHRGQGLARYSDELLLPGQSPGDWRRSEQPGQRSYGG
jgi:hypothetical protein